jgi:hypothetical protein
MQAASIVLLYLVGPIFEMLVNGSKGFSSNIDASAPRLSSLALSPGSSPGFTLRSISASTERRGSGMPPRHVTDAYATTR